MKKITLISLICIFIDQITKLIIKNTINLHSSIILIKNFFSLAYVKNYGAAWSILSGSRIFLITIALVSLYLIYNYFIKNKDLNKLEIITYGLLIGGIIGNLIDRIVFGYVIDFFDFLIFNYNFPVFNFADIFIVVSAGLIIIDTFRSETHEIRSKH